MFLFTFRSENGTEHHIGKKPRNLSQGLHDYRNYDHASHGDLSGRTHHDHRHRQTDPEATVPSNVSSTM
jgi:hypothetical protein